MKVLFKEPGKLWRTMVIPNELKVLQDLVGGYIETVTITKDCTVICNEEGRIKDLPENVQIAGVDFVGPVLLVGVDRDEFTDVPDGLEGILCRE